MNETYTYYGGNGIGLWRINLNGRIEYYGGIFKWYDSMFNSINEFKPFRIIQIDIEEVLKRFPKAIKLNRKESKNFKWI
jgi:hypothetical protein